MASRAASPGACLLGHQGQRRCCAGSQPDDSWASVRRSQKRKLFCKGFTGARRHVTEEAPDLHLQSHRTSLTGQISQGAHVTAMDAAGWLITDRTRDLRERRSQNQCEQMALELEIFQQHSGRERKQRGIHGLFLQGERIGIRSYSFLIIPPLGRFTENAPEPVVHRILHQGFRLYWKSRTTCQCRL